MFADIPTKNPAKLKEWLDGLPAGEKGRAFEQVLAELYRGNGWIVSVQGQRGDEGADILLSHPKTPHSVSLIVQAKNHAKPLTQDQTRIELIKFEQQAALRYQCQQFRLVAVNGYVADATKFGVFNLLLDSWDHVTALLKNYSPDSKKLPDIELFAHNRATYDEVVRLWQENDQVAVVQATGTGKSFVIAKVMSDFHGRQKIVLAPSSHYILDQQKGKAPWLNDKTTYWTYAGLARRSETEIKSLKCSLIVLDEFHRCGADIWGKGVQKLLDSHPRAKVLGTSATPIRYLDASRDMAEELFDGVVATELSLAEAIVKRILPAPTYISALYTLDEEIKNLLEEVDASKRSEEEKESYGKELEAIKVDWEKTSGVPEILKKYLPKDINKIIVFCNDQEHLDQMEVEVQKWFQKARTHKFREKYRILSADPASKKNLEKFKEASGKDTIHLLFAIDMLNEGLHIPEVGAVILLRPTESPNIFYQQIGRCIEVGANHTPIIFDLVNNLQSIRAGSLSQDLMDAEAEEDFKRKEQGLDKYAPTIRIEDLSLNIEDVLKNIRDRLMPWEIMYDALRVFKEKYGNCRVPRFYEANPYLGSWVSEQRQKKSSGRLSKDRISKLIELGFVWSSFEDSWDAMYNELRLFKEKAGHCNVPKHYAENPYLGQWVVVQRMKWRNGDLFAPRRDKLNDLGFDFNFLDANWNTMYELLRSFKSQFGHCSVPNRFIENRALGTWVQNQRKAYKSNKGYPKDRQLKMESLGFVWDTLEADWDEKYEALRKFKEKYGHCNVPRTYPENPNLGAWIHQQRKAYKSNKGYPNDRLLKMESLGFVWDTREADWDEKYKALHKFKEKYGHCNVPNRYSECPELATWVYNQRSRYKKGYPANRLSKMTAIGFIWETLAAKWNEKYAELVRFKEKHGHCNVPASYPENPSLGTWVGTQRKDYKSNNPYSQERVEKMEAVGFIWNVLDAKWEEMYEKLLLYRQKNKDCNVPIHYAEEPALGVWVNTQRIAWKKQKISRNRIQRLEKIGFQWVIKS